MIWNTPEESSFLNAAATGKIDVVNDLLTNHHVNVNVKDDRGTSNTALIFAASTNHVEVVKLLLKRGADVNIKNVYGYTALMYAVNNKHIEVVKALKLHATKVEIPKAASVTEVQNPPKDSLWKRCVTTAREYKDRLIKLLMKPLQKITDRQKKIIFVALAITILAIALYFLYKYKKKQATSNVAQAIKDADAVAVANPSDLTTTMAQSKQLMDQGKVEEAGVKAVASMKYLFSQK